MCSFLALGYIGRKYQVSYEETIKRVFNIFLTTIVMVILLLMFKYLLPSSSTSRLVNILYVILFSSVGGIIYLFIMVKTKLIYDVFG